MNLGRKPYYIAEITDIIAHRPRTFRVPQPGIPITSMYKELRGVDTKTLTRQELRNHLEARDLSTFGNKGHLAERLKVSVLDEQASDWEIICNIFALAVDSFMGARTEK